MTDEYIKIAWSDVRKGDVLFHENGDRLTVTERVDSPLHGATFTEFYTFRSLAFTSGELQEAGFTPYRRKPEMPSVPGPHLDKDGDVWVQEDNGTDNTWRYGHDGLLYSAEDAARHAPFTRLVPMPTEENVNSSIFKGFSGSQVSGVYIERATDAVVALLNGEADDE